MDARSVEDFRAEVIAQTGKTSLVEHERSTLLSVDAFGLQMGEQIIGCDVFVEDIRSEASEKGMAVFLGVGKSTISVADQSRTACLSVMKAARRLRRERGSVVLRWTVQRPYSWLWLYMV